MKEYDSKKKKGSKNAPHIMKFPGEINEKLLVCSHPAPRRTATGQPNKQSLRLFSM
jgi:hypothetical protein